MSTKSTSSVSTDTVVYFITGSNRGIGFGLTEKLAGRPNTLIFATARDPSKADKLQQLAKQHSNIRVVALKVDSDADHTAAAKQVELEAGRVDVLIANAGIANHDAYQPTEEMSIDKLREHFEVNTVGPVRLFTTFFPLLKRSTTPKFIVVSSQAGSITIQADYPAFRGTCYGSSKAAINFITQRIHVEHPSIVTLPIHPGWVQTDMGNAGAVAYGLKEAPLTLETSVDAILKVVDVATRDRHSGKLWDTEKDKQLPW